MKKNIVHVRAKRVRKGMTFMLFHEECFIVDTSRNDFSQTVIRFVVNSKKDSRVSHIVIDSETYFEIKTN